MDKNRPGASLGGGGPCLAAKYLAGQKAMPMDQSLPKLTSDIMFKAVISHPQNELGRRSMLQAFFGPIMDITSCAILNPELLPLREDGKSAVADLLIDADKGVWINVEMQPVVSQRLLTRLHGYHSLLTCHRSLKGLHWQDKPIRCFAICTQIPRFMLGPHNLTKRHPYDLVQGMIHGAPYTSVLNIGLVSLDYALQFDEPGWRDTPFYNWSYVLRNSTDKGIEGYMDKDFGLRQTMSIFNELADDKEMLEAIQRGKEIMYAQEQMMNALDKITERMQKENDAALRKARAASRKEGLKEGIEKGLEKGRKEAQYAKNLKFAAYLLAKTDLKATSVESIAAALDVSVEEATAIIKTLESPTK